MHAYHVRISDHTDEIKVRNQRNAFCEDRGENRLLKSQNRVPYRWQYTYMSRRSDC